MRLRFLVLALGIGMSATTSALMPPAASTSGCFVDTTQTDFQTPFGTDCDITTNSGSVQLSTIDQQNATAGDVEYGFTSTQWAGQTFTASVTGNMNRADLYLTCSFCSGTDPDILVSIRETAGGLPTGVDLATAIIPGFSSDTAAYYTADFGVWASLTAGTTYALIFRSVTDRIQGQYRYQVSNGSEYPGGQNVFDSNSGSSWTADANADMGFRIYMMAVYAQSGSLVSSRKDAITPAGTVPTWGTISWNASVPAGTTLRFRVAASDSAIGTFTFVGPDGTASTDFPNGASLAQFNGKRYLHYQALLTGDGVETPVLNDVTICFSSARPGVDLNADASGDVFTYSATSGDWKRQLAQSNGTFLESSGTWDADWTIVPAHFNADRLTDLFLFNTTSGQWYRMENDGAGFTAQATDFWWPGWQRHIMDLDGDGLSDVFLYDPASGVWFKAVSTPGSVTYSQGGWNPNWEITPMTLNADALGDMFLIDRATGRWFWVLGEAGPGFTYPVSETWYPAWKLYRGDFNGDGLSDLVLHDPPTGAYFVAMNNALGTGFTYTQGGWSLGWTPHVGDLDANGIEDLLLHDAATGAWFEMTSDGSGGFTNAGGQTWSLGWSIYPTDFNVDGRTDFLLYDPVTGVWYQARNLTLGEFEYTSGTWSPNLIIIARSF